MSQSKAQLTNPFGTVNITDGVNVSGVITATTLIGDGTALTGIALTGDINTSGIITASEFYGYGGSLSNVGLGTEDSINTTGIITAAQFYGDGSLLTNIGGAFTPLTFNPTNGQTNVGLTTNIVITFNKPIQAGVGTITLRTDSASGTIVESYDVTSSDRLTFSAGTLTIDPTASLSGLTTYYTVLPAGTVKDTYGLDDNTLIDNYSFTTQQFNYELWAWGYNSYAALGQNDRTHRSSPVQIPGTQWSLVWNNYLQTSAIKSDGTLWVWGYNVYGSLGQNDIVDRSSPVQIPGTQWEDIVGGYLNSIAKKTDGTLWSWGYNGNGQLGLGSRSNLYYSSPVQVPGTQWDQIFPIGYVGYRSLASKTDGTLWTWGRNIYGNLGQNNTTYYSSPVQIPGTQWNVTSKYTVSSGDTTVFGIKTDGTLWAWGSNYDGGLGQNNRTYYSSPRQVPGTQWSEVSASQTHTLATKTDGTLWGWGSGSNGQFGLNNTVKYSSPVQIPGTQWTKPNALYATSSLLKTDGTLWVWGYNGYGQSANNDKQPYSSPIQVPGTQWTVTSGKVYEVFAIKQTT